MNSVPGSPAAPQARPSVCPPRKTGGAPACTSRHFTAGNTERGPGHHPRRAGGCPSQIGGRGKPLGRAAAATTQPDAGYSHALAAPGADGSGCAQRVHPRPAGSDGPRIAAPPSRAPPALTSPPYRVAGLSAAASGSRRERLNAAQGPPKASGPLGSGGRLPGPRSGIDTRRTAGYSCSAAVVAC